MALTNFYFVNQTTNVARQRVIAAFMWLGLGASSLFLFFFNPALPHNQFFPKCPFRLVTGWQCPGCGSTRAFYQLLHLHPVAAFKLNPLIMLTLPFIVTVFSDSREARSPASRIAASSSRHLICGRGSRCCFSF